MRLQLLDCFSACDRKGWSLWPTEDNLVLATTCVDVCISFLSNNWIEQKLVILMLCNTFVFKISKESAYRINNKHCFWPLD